MAQLVSSGKKVLMTTTMCRIPQGMNQGIQSIISQHNQILGKVKSATHRRKKIVEDTADYTKSLNNPVDATIGGDCNQDIAPTEVQQFFNELQMKDVHQTTNVIELNEIDHTYSRVTKHIDSIAATPNARKHIERRSLHGTNEIINTDHRSCVIDINLEECFLEEFSE